MTATTRRSKPQTTDATIALLEGLRDKIDALPRPSGEPARDPMSFELLQRIATIIEDLRPDPYDFAIGAQVVVLGGHTKMTVAGSHMGPDGRAMIDLVFPLDAPGQPFGETSLPAGVLRNVHATDVAP